MTLWPHGPASRPLSSRQHNQLTTLQLILAPFSLSYNWRVPGQADCREILRDIVSLVRILTQSSGAGTYSKTSPGAREHGKRAFGTVHHGKSRLEEFTHVRISCTQRDESHTTSVGDGPPRHGAELVAGSCLYLFICTCVL